MVEETLDTRSIQVPKLAGLPGGRIFVCLGNSSTTLLNLLAGGEG